MKILAAIPLLAALIAPPSNPVREYPIHFHMVYLHYNMRQNSTHGEGIANISEEGQPTRGFKFTFDSCNGISREVHFPHEMPARWNGKDRYQLIVQRIDLGSNTTEECILDGRLQDFKYEKVNGKPSEVPLTPPTN